MEGKGLFVARTIIHGRKAGGVKKKAVAYAGLHAYGFCLFYGLLEGLNGSATDSGIACILNKF